MIGDLTFLEQGKFTRINRKYIKLAKKIKSSGKAPVESVSEVLLEKLHFEGSRKPLEFKKRSAI